MTFAEVVLAVHDWMRRLPPAQVRAAIKRQLDSEEGVEGLCRGFPVGAVLVMVRMGLGPGMRPVVFRELRGEAPDAPRRDEAPETAIASENPKAEPEAAEAPEGETPAESTEEEEEEEVLEDASELGEDEDDMAEVIENVDEEETTCGAFLA